MHIQPSTYQTSDGLNISYHHYGVAGGKPAFYFHGLPGSRYEGELLHTAAINAGVELIAPDRFGYGDTTPVSTDRYLRWVGAIAELADELCFRQFYVLAASGGAPYALACASRLHTRVIATGIACGLGPLAVSSLHRSMALMERMAAWLGRHAPLLLTLSYGSLARLLVRYFPRQMLNLVGWYNGGADKEILADPDVRRILTANLRCAFKQGSTGGVQDLMAVTRPWPFDLTAIHTLQLWHGDKDPIVPLLHSQWITQHIPHAQLRIIENEGHFSLPIKYAQQIITLLVDLANTSNDDATIPLAD